MNNLIIWHAQQEDAPWIARVQVETWQSAYRGLIPQEYINTLDVSKKTEQWQKKIILNWELILIAVYNGKVVWFITWWESRDKIEYDWEIRAFYVLEECQWKWIGTQLFDAMGKEFKQLWFKSFYLWVLHNWPAREFYENKWWKYIDEKIEKIGDIEIVEVSYGWKNIE